MKFRVQRGRKKKSPCSDLYQAAQEPSGKVTHLVKIVGLRFKSGGNSFFPFQKLLGCSSREMDQMGVLKHS